jgi:hypothetical protein
MNKSTFNKLISHLRNAKRILKKDISFYHHFLFLSNNCKNIFFLIVDISDNQLDKLYSEGLLETLDYILFFNYSFEKISNDLRLRIQKKLGTNL